jgi:GR25 family glycosyltransferase involved in LPS biosynthesis
MLRAIVANAYNTNFFASVDENGFYRPHPDELHLLYRKRPGVHEVPLVHMTYLIDCEAIPKLRYDDGTNRYEFVAFSASARAGGVAQYIDTRYRYGYITCDDDREHAQAHFGAALDDPAGEARALLFPSGPAPAPPATLALCISRRGSLRREPFAASAREVGLEFEFRDAITRTELMHGFRVDGCTLDLTHLSWVANEQNDPRRAHAPMSFAEIGCAYSHIRCWQEALKQNVDALFVFEDDVSFTRPLTDIMMPPDGDILYLENRMGRDGQGHAAPNGCGAAGYMLSRAGIRKCLEIFSVLYMPIDLQLMIHQHSQIAHSHRLAGFRRNLPDEILLTSYVAEHPYCRHPEYQAGQSDITELSGLSPAARPATVSTSRQLPPMHVINLDRSKVRWNEFRTRNFHLGAINRFSAIDGAALDLDELRRTGKIAGEPAYKIGMLGCALSHAALWETAATTGQALTIFEDDAVTAHGFVSAAERILAGLPADWDFISWGYILNPLFAWVELPVSKIRMQDYGPNRICNEEDLRRFQEEPILPVAMRLRHCFGLQAYSISPSGARAALDYFLPIRTRQIEFLEASVSTPDCGPDVSLCGLYPHLKAYIAVPQLAIHYDGGLSPRKVLDGEMEEAA